MTVLDYKKLTTGGIVGTEWYADVTSNVEWYDNFESGTAGRGPNLSLWQVNTYVGTCLITTAYTPGSVMFGGTKGLVIYGAGISPQESVQSKVAITNRHVLCCWQYRMTHQQSNTGLYAPIRIAFGNDVDGWHDLVQYEIYIYGPGLGNQYSQARAIEAIALGNDKYDFYYCGLRIYSNISKPNGIKLKALIYWLGEIYIDNIAYSKSI